MSDYRLRITVRNARLLRAIEKAGHQPGPSFAKLAGIRYGVELLPYLNLMRSPLTPDGLLRECAWNLCDFLGASPSDLWSDEQLTPLDKNHSSVDLDLDDMRSLIGDPASMAEKEETRRLVLKAVDALYPSRRDVIRERFFLGKTRIEVAKKRGCCVQRIAQMENQAFRDLRKLGKLPTHDDFSK